MKMANKNQSNQDKLFMKQALSLAQKGRGRVSPNPCVGALVVKNGKIVGKGYHQAFGGPHAEVVALRAAAKLAKGGTLYVTLEPCSTYGKTPPCTQSILNSGIRRVVIGTHDPNPQHRGKGKRLLQRSKLQVTAGVEENNAEDLITYFRHWIKNKIPYVIVKEAMTLDGKIATRKGDSQWISSQQSREFVHQLRSQVDAILVGKRTLLKDNPRLTSRSPGQNGNQPIRVLLAKDGLLPTHLKVFSSQLPGRTWLVTAKNLPKRVKLTWEKKGIDLIEVKSIGSQLDNLDLLKKLAQKGVTSLLIEGGGETVFPFFKFKLVNKLYLFVAPKIIGGREAITPVEGKGLSQIHQALIPNKWSWKKVGDDLLIEADF